MSYNQSLPEPPYLLSQFLFPAESVFTSQISCPPLLRSEMSPVLSEREYPPTMYPPSFVCSKVNMASSPLPPNLLSHNLFPAESALTSQKSPEPPAAGLCCETSPLLSELVIPPKIKLLSLVIFRV